jgi:transcriptional regulator with XRE-family HTH domain
MAPQGIRISPRKNTVSELEKWFGAQVKGLRVGRGLTQLQLAFRAGLPRTYITAVEHGVHNVLIQSIGKIAAGLGVSAAQLLSEAREHPRKSAVPIKGYGKFQKRLSRS